MKKAQKTKKILVALSGGVDSAVAAFLLLKQGYMVEAVFMKNWSSGVGLRNNDCPWLEDRRSALRVAAFLGIPLHTLDFENEYQKKVMQYFFSSYKKGLTPNPDVMCNKEIKFKLLYNWAMKQGFDCLATGHYASVTFNKRAQTYELHRSLDEFKDQTYFIYNIHKNQLSNLIFPIGGMIKKEVKLMAKKIHLPNAERKESMGLCFVGKIRLKDFLEQKLKIKPGPICDQNGTVVGEHQGLHYYTLGQRQGIRVGGFGPYYVFKKDLTNNTLHVTNNPDDPKLYIKEVGLVHLNWLVDLPLGKVKLCGRFRHQGDLVPLTLEFTKTDVMVNFNRPQKALASGQSLVIYSGVQVLGGGVIA